MKSNIFKIYFYIFKEKLLVEEAGKKKKRKGIGRAF
jgi:hypothetical protein